MNKRSSKKVIYKRWWFWLIVIFFAIIAINGIGGGEPDSKTIDQPKQATSKKKSSTKAENKPEKKTTTESTPKTDPNAVAELQEKLKSNNDFDAMLTDYYKMPLSDQSKAWDGFLYKGTVHLTDYAVVDKSATSARLISKSRYQSLKSTDVPQDLLPYVIIVKHNIDTSKLSQGNLISGNVKLIGRGNQAFTSGKRHISSANWDAEIIK